MFKKHKEYVELNWKVILRPIIRKKNNELVIAEQILLDLGQFAYSDLIGELLLEWIDENETKINN